MVITMHSCQHLSFILYFHVDFMGWLVHLYQYIYILFLHSQDLLYDVIANALC